MPSQSPHTIFSLNGQHTTDVGHRELAILALFQKWAKSGFLRKSGLEGQFWSPLVPALLRFLSQLILTWKVHFQQFVWTFKKLTPKSPLLLTSAQDKKSSKVPIWGSFFKKFKQIAQKTRSRSK